MVEFVLVAVLHLSGDELGPEMVIDFYPTIQECIVHNKELHVPTAPDEYVLPTTYLADKTAAGGTAIKYNARLFLFDYHNIIGSSRYTVGSSSEVTWEATVI